jgi:anti-sigma regulatory factor (Ser/Thr protein kinase)
MKDSVVVTIPSQAKYLSVVRAATVNIGKLYGMDEPVIEDVKLAVDEACSNVIKHAYKGNPSRKIVVKYRAIQDRFEVIIEDNGMKGRMELMKGRSLDDIRPGGLGIHFIKRVFDVFEFDEKKKDGNRLILIKYMKGNG